MMINVPVRSASAPHHRDPALRVLRWTFAAVLGGQAALALISHRHHLPVIAIAATELIGCAALALRPRWRGGAGLVLASLLGSVAVHAELGEWPPPAYAIDAACLLVLATERPAASGVRDA